MNRRRHAAPVIAALALLGLLLGVGTGAAKVSHAPKNRSLPHVSGSPFVGRTLVASHGRWTRRPRGYSFRWLACNTAGKRCRSIPHAKSARYTLRVRDLRARIRVAVRAWNRSGAGQAMSPATSMVAEVVPPAPPPRRLRGHLRRPTSSTAATTTSPTAATTSSASTTSSAATTSPAAATSPTATASSATSPATAASSPTATAATAASSATPTATATAAATSTSTAT